MIEISHQRASNETINEQKNFFLDNNRTTYLLDKVPDVVLILNEYRQIIYSNNNLLRLIDAEIIDTVYGKRPGEVLNCIHSKENLLGCGTAEFCNECGAYKAIISSTGGVKDVQECRIIQEGTGIAFDFRVYTTPIEIDSRNFVMFSIVDISNEKRKEVLERTFFHDLVNIAVGIKSIMDILEIDLPDELSKYRKLIKTSATRLLEEINAQKQLIAAENYSLILDNKYICSKEIICEVVSLVEFYDFVENVEIKIADDMEDFIIFSDKVLLRRVITNLMKNAIEAEYPDGEVTIGCYLDNDEARFWVKNKSVMTKDVQLQLFQRSFSTKGRGRGIGTYSVKLLTEKYLGGRVDFSSSEEKGTIFNLYYPIKPIEKSTEI